MKILGSEITPYKTYLNRRKFIKGSLASAMLATVTSSAFANHDSDLSIYTKNLNEINQMLKDGEIKPLVSKTFPMERAVEAINLIGNRGVIGKVVLTNE